MSIRATVTHSLFRVQSRRCVHSAGRFLDERGSSFFRRGIAVNDHAVAVELRAQYKPFSAVSTTSGSGSVLQPPANETARREGGQR